MADRFAVFLLEPVHNRWPAPSRFNACFDARSQAVDEAHWYVARGYCVIVAIVPDGLNRYMLPHPDAWIRSYRLPKDL